MKIKLVEILNIILENNDLKKIGQLNLKTPLQSDLEMDSLLLAELKVI